MKKVLTLLTLVLISGLVMGAKPVPDPVCFIEDANITAPTGEEIVTVEIRHRKTTNADVPFQLTWYEGTTNHQQFNTGNTPVVRNVWSIKADWFIAAGNVTDWNDVFVEACYSVAPSKIEVDYISITKS